jgi:hypothetical protein
VAVPRQLNCSFDELFCPVLLVLLLVVALSLYQIRSWSSFGDVQIQMPALSGISDAESKDYQDKFFRGSIL